MTAHASTFAEVLEEEYRYFFEDEPFSEVKFGPEHIREMADLAKFLASIDITKEEWSSRWFLLATEVFGAKGTFHEDPKDPTIPAELAPKYAVLRAFNRLLRSTVLLERLMKDERYVGELRASAEHQRLLLRVPQMRRYLLSRPELACELGRDAIIDEFASCSAPIRVLLERHDFRPVFRAYPALLGTIADDETLATTLIDDQHAHALLRDHFVAKQKGVWRWLVEHNALLHRVFGNKVVREPALVGLSCDPAGIRNVLRVAGPPDANEIKVVALTRFNAILLELAYSDYVAKGQTVRAVNRAMLEKNTAALCLSGGGIRSATFNLGVLQGLADHRLLNRFHYLSTVSGGGYTGSWFSSWARRHHEGAIGVAKDLSRRAIDPANPEVEPIEHLREYSSYLAPRASAFSLDMWTIVTTYLRNLLLNWTMLIPSLAAVIAIPRIVEACVRGGIPEPYHEFGEGAIVFGVLAVSIIGLVRPPTSLPLVDEPPKQLSKWVMWFWLTPLLLSSALFCIDWACPHGQFRGNPTRLMVIFASGAAGGATLFALRRSLTEVVADISSNQTVLQKIRALATFVFRFLFHEPRTRLEILFAGIAGTLGGFLVHTFFTSAFPLARLDDGVWKEIYVCLAIPLFLAAFFLSSTLLVGLTTFLWKDHDREWWARTAAAFFVTCVFYGLGAFAVLLLPLFIMNAPELAAPVGGLSAIASYIFSSALKSIGAAKPKSQWLMPALRIAASISLLFVVAGISMMTTEILTAVNVALGHVSYDAIATWSQQHLQTLRETRPWIAMQFALIATLAAFFMSRILNVNFYSMHAMYRNRLIRAYLGASRWLRRPDAFTGFDPQDNLNMIDLRPEMLWASSFINFDRFAIDVQNVKPLWDMLDVDTRNRICGYVEARKTKGRRMMREAARAVVVTNINTLMLSRDLQHNVPAQPSLSLLRANCDYLKGKFKDTLKWPERTVALPDDGLIVPRNIDPTLIKEVHGRPPLHVFNVALNLVHGDNLAWQERKADSFTISPLHCGNRLVGYRDSAEYAGAISLGTAMAISGAAVSPNMGAMSSTAFTFLMTLFNARLGWWLGNPAKSKYKKRSPTGSIGALLREALGMTNAEHEFVFLSDGGHFENLGLYEMVKRRCRYIVVCDATADGDYAFGDLANAVRKIRVDLGIPIEPLVTKYFGPQGDEHFGRYCAFGKIRYDNVDGGTMENTAGELLYIKPCVYSDCPTDVRNYGEKKAAFPHETTADQFFSESQFESYRALGRFILGRMCGDTPNDEGPWIAKDMENFFARADGYVRKGMPEGSDPPTRKLSDVAWMAMRAQTNTKAASLHS